MLRCVMIITSVVPPDLPMQLSLAVNYSIISMIRKNIFCTEPFRIPLAGKVNICCFDKTGTLTKNDLIVKGTTALKINNQAKGQVDEKVIPLDEVSKNSKDALIILAGCHTLAMADNVLIGDPIEK